MSEDRVLIQVEHRPGRFQGRKEKHRRHLEDLGQCLSDLGIPDRELD